MVEHRDDLPGLTWRQVTPDPLADTALAPFADGHDLLGDGSTVLLPTPGHTPGSLSMLVRRPAHPPLLMVGDLTYDADLLAAGELPGVGERTAAEVEEVAERLYRTIDELTEGTPVQEALTLLRAFAGGFPAGQALARRASAARA